MEISEDWSCSVVWLKQAIIHSSCFGKQLKNQHFFPNLAANLRQQSYQVHWHTNNPDLFLFIDFQYRKKTSFQLPTTHRVIISRARASFASTSARVVPGRWHKCRESQRYGGVRSSGAKIRRYQSNTTTRCYPVVEGGRQATCSDSCHKTERYKLTVFVADRGTFVAAVVELGGRDEVTVG